ncbi:hypothetical protein [Sphaerisporangium rhizosphaerae]|uniref:Uncharacterized protein n=1 Tax=Sphaerisporangium rhizosphaerae TaxID=2269375 RepID=A0ABW2P996_9ACTN
MFAVFRDGVPVKVAARAAGQGSRMVWPPRAARIACRMHGGFPPGGAGASPRMAGVRAT